MHIACMYRPSQRPQKCVTLLRKYKRRRRAQIQWTYHENSTTYHKTQICPFFFSGGTSAWNPPPSSFCQEMIDDGANLKNDQWCQAQIQKPWFILVHSLSGGSLQIVIVWYLIGTPIKQPFGVYKSWVDICWHYCTGQQQFRAILTLWDNSDRFETCPADHR